MDDPHKDFEWESILKKFDKEATDQVKAAAWHPVEWHFAEKRVADAVREHFEDEGINVKVLYTPMTVVFVPQDEGIGVSRRLDDEERARLKDILKSLDLPTGGVIVRTAAEGASAEDIERDLVFLQKLWKEIQARAKKSPAPSLI